MHIIARAQSSTRYSPTKQWPRLYSSFCVITASLHTYSNEINQDPTSVVFMHQYQVFSYFLPRASRLHPPRRSAASAGIVLSHSKNSGVPWSALRHVFAPETLLLSCFSCSERRGKTWHDRAHNYDTIPTAWRKKTAAVTTTTGCKDKNDTHCAPYYVVSGVLL